MLGDEVVSADHLVLIATIVEANRYDLADAILSMALACEAHDEVGNLNGLASFELWLRHLLFPSGIIAVSMLSILPCAVVSVKYYFPLAEDSLLVNNAAHEVAKYYRGG